MRNDLQFTVDWNLLWRLSAFNMFWRRLNHFNERMEAFVTAVVVFVALKPSYRLLWYFWCVLHRYFPAASTILVCLDQQNIIEKMVCLDPDEFIKSPSNHFICQHKHCERNFRWDCAVAHFRMRRLHSKMQWLFSFAWHSKWN